MTGTSIASMISIGIHYQKSIDKSSFKCIQPRPAFQTKENPPGKKYR